MLVLGLCDHVLLLVRAELQCYYQPVLQGQLLRKTVMFPVLSGLNWRRAERGADRTSQRLRDLMAASSDPVPEALSL